MTQRIWLIRHGKSVRPFGTIDHQRPLAARASADAAAVRDWLNDAPQMYVTSTAKRAQKTAEMIAGNRSMVPRDELYHVDESTFLDIIEETLADVDSAAFVAHNPTVTDLVNRLASRTVTDNVPTLGVAAFEREYPTASWRLVAYITPKEIR